MNPVLDQQSGNVFEAAVQWLQGLLLGTVASAIAVIAVASVGFLLLSGRIDVRRAVHVIFGCFILFGASSIAAGIMREADRQSNDETAVALPPPAYPTVPVQPPQSARAATPYDPYAGAAMPTR